MNSGFAELDAMIATVRAIPRLCVTAAPEVADAMRAELGRTIAAGTSPEGKRWDPRKRDRGQPLANALASVHVGAVGSTIYVRLTGPAARHHLGHARGGTVRQVIPVDRLSPELAAIVRDTLAQKFDELVAKGGA